MEESESKKQTDTELQQLQQTVGNLEDQVASLQEDVAVASASASGLQQELDATRCTSTERHVFKLLTFSQKAVVDLLIVLSDANGTVWPSCCFCLLLKPPLGSIAVIALWW